MNYAQARQRQSDLRWDWTVANKRAGTYPSGYCGGWSYDRWLADPTNLVMPRQLLEREAAARRPFQAKYHTDGHATREEAERCHYEYALDLELQEGTIRPDEQHRCQAPDCAEWTQHYLSLGAYRAQTTFLCDAHRTRDVFAALHPFSPGSWEAFS